MDANTSTPANRVLNFLEDLFNDAVDSRARLLEADDEEVKIKDRITCLKYLEDIAKAYMALKKDATDDPAHAGSTVRKYATAFTKNAVGGGKKNSRHRPKSAEPDESDSNGDEFGLE
jgi:hypothetical protein